MGEPSSAISGWRRRVYDVLEGGHPASVARAFDGGMVVLILANVLAVALETVPGLDQRYRPYFQAFEAVSVMIFTAEYGLRLWAAPEHPPLRAVGPARGRLRLALTPYLVIDLLAILPFYLAFLVPADLRVLRIFRLVRLLKLARYSPALGTIWQVLRTERRALLGSLIVMLGLTLLSSTLVYYAEREVQPERFGSVPAATWWALATLTTSATATWSRSRWRARSSGAHS